MCQSQNVASYEVAGEVSSCGIAGRKAMKIFVENISAVAAIADRTANDVYNRPITLSLIHI